MKTITHWEKEMAFTSIFDGHSVSLNGASDENGKRLGYSPKALLLSGLAGCSGIDVVEMLEKMRVPFTKLEIVAQSEQTEEHPKVFKDIEIEYRIDAEPQFEDKIKRAVNLSIEKYCGVAAMLKKNSTIIPTVTFIK
jgi:putative redox protein